MTYLTTSPLCVVCFCFCFCFGCAACGILVPWPGLEPRPTAVKTPSPNHWTARELPPLHHFWMFRVHLFFLSFALVSHTILATSLGPIPRNECTETMNLKVEKAFKPRSACLQIQGSFCWFQLSCLLPARTPEPAQRSQVHTGSPWVTHFSPGWSRGSELWSSFFSLLSFQFDGGEPFSGAASGPVLHSMCRQHTWKNSTSLTNGSWKSRR